MLWGFFFLLVAWKLWKINGIKIFQNIFAYNLLVYAKLPEIWTYQRDNQPYTHIIGLLVYKFELNQKFVRCIEEGNPQALHESTQCCYPFKGNLYEVLMMGGPIYMYLATNKKNFC